MKALRFILSLLLRIALPLLGVAMVLCALSFSCYVYLTPETSLTGTPEVVTNLTGITDEVILSYYDASTGTFDMEGLSALLAEEAISGLDISAPYTLKSETTIDVSSNLFSFLSYLVTGTNEGTLIIQGGETLTANINLGTTTYSQSLGSFSLNYYALSAIIMAIVGLFLTCCGYKSKLATFLGTLLLTGAAVICFLPISNLNEGLAYSVNMVESRNMDESGALTYDGIESLFSFSLSYLKASYCAVTMAGLSLLTFLLSLTRHLKKGFNAKE